MENTRNNPQYIIDWLIKRDSKVELSSVFEKLQINKYTVIESSHHSSPFEMGTFVEEQICHGE